MKTLNLLWKVGMIFFFLIGTSLTGFSQEKVQKDTVIYRVTMKDGSTIHGKLIFESESELIIETETLGRVTIARNDISKIKKVDASAFRKGKYWFPNPNATRYFFAPSAFPLEPNQGYYQNIYVVFNSFNIGISKGLSIGAGIEFFSTFVTLAAGEFQPIFFITPKMGFNVAEKFNLGRALCTK